MSRLIHSRRCTSHTRRTPRSSRRRGGTVGRDRQSPPSGRSPHCAPSVDTPRTSRRAPRGNPNASPPAVLGAGSSPRRPFVGRPAHPFFRGAHLRVRPICALPVRDVGPRGGPDGRLPARPGGRLAHLSGRYRPDAGGTPRFAIALEPHAPPLVGAPLAVHAPASSLRPHVEDTLVPVGVVARPGWGPASRGWGPVKGA